MLNLQQLSSLDSVQRFYNRMKNKHKEEFKVINVETVIVDVFCKYRVWYIIN